MRKLDNLRLEYYEELMKKAGDEKWNQSMDVDEKVRKLEAKQRKVGPNQRKVIGKTVEVLKTKAREIRKASSLDYDIAASIGWSLNNKE